jgi:hypothetical protein
MKSKKKGIGNTPVEKMGILTKDRTYNDTLELQKDKDDVFAVVTFKGREGSICLKSWRGWLRFLTDELRSELYENIADEYLDRFESDFDDIIRFVNLAIAGEDRFELDETMDSFRV